MKEKLTTELFSDVGMGELFMARLIHFQDRILMVHGPGVSKEEIQQAIFTTMFDGLEPAFQSLRELRKEWADPRIPKQKKKRDLEGFYSHLAIAWQDRFPVVTRLMGYNISFIFQKEEKYLNGKSKFIEEHQTLPSGFIRAMEEDRDIWGSTLQKIRNSGIQHVGSNIQDKKKLAMFMTLESAEQMFTNCWQAMEDYMAAFTQDKVDPKFQMLLGELPEYRSNKNHPERFSWYVAT